MSEEAQKGGSRLGRGLAALIGDVNDENGAVQRARSQRRVPFEFLRPNPRNPRKTFVEEDLESLAQSIREKGLLQPILVRPVKGEANAFEIVAGERRWRASQRAQLPEVPVIIQEFSDSEALEIAIVENVQRSDLNAIEEAMGYDQLIEEFKYSQAEVAKVIGKSRSHVANTLRLLKLPNEVKEQVRSGKLSAGHARALVGRDDATEVAERIVEKGMTVRDAEAIAGKPEKGGVKQSQSSQKDVNILDLEKRIEDALGFEVALIGRGERGELRIKYATYEQLEVLCQKLGVK